MNPSLEQRYRQWQDLQSKGEMKMRVKLDKDNNQYYDFDFSRYQYYYNYPQQHFAFLPPQKQQQLFNELFKHILNVSLLYNNHQTQHKGFQQSSLDNNKSNNNIQTSLEQTHLKDHNNKPNSSHSTNYQCDDQQYQSPLLHLLKPYQLQEFLYDYTERIKRKVTTLRIKKSLLTPIKCNEFIKDTQPKTSPTSAIIELIETQIRSYLSKLSKITSYDFQFGQNIAQRFQQKKSHLKTINRDEIHFSQLQKSDFIIYERLIKTDHKFIYPMKCINQEISIILQLRQMEIKRQACMQSLKRLNQITQREKRQYESRKQVIIKWLDENEPQFLQQFTNVSAIDQFLTNLTYTNKLSSSKSRGYLDINLHYKDIAFIPSNKQQLLSFIESACRMYFPQQMMEKLMGKGKYKQTYSQQHLCYKLIRLGSTVFRITQQTYDLTRKQQDKEILTKKVLMRRQLETVFAKDLQKLLNIPQHQTVQVIGQSDPHNSYTISQLQQALKTQLTQKQLIYEQYFKEYEFQDAMLYSLGNLLFVRKEKVLHEVIDQYMSLIKKKSVMQRKVQHIMLYYENLHNDPKNHLINIINKKLSYTHQRQSNPNYKKFLSILSQQNQLPQHKLSFQLLKASYFLRLVSTINTKNKLLEVINGQVNLMYKVKHKLEYLRKKNQLKFQLSKEFMARFTETNQQNPNPFTFFTQTEILDDKVTFSVEQDQLIITQRDSSENNNTNPINLQINHHSTNIQVRRRSAQNPLYEGKKIIYPVSIIETEKLISQRLLKLGSWIISKRQNYLNAEELTHIVDRVHLLSTLMDSETDYQLEKLKLMQQYQRIFELQVTPEGISQLSLKLYKLKHEQFSLPLNQPSFIQEYQYAITNFKQKQKLLKQLGNIFIGIEKNQVIEVKNGIMRSNLSNNLPEISSIYYHETSKVGDEIGEEEESDLSDNQQQQCQNSSRSNNNNSVNPTTTNLNNNTNTHRSSRSQSLAQSVVMQTSSLNNKSSYKYGDYHVKKSFRQILNMNQTAKAKRNSDKKELLLNRKRKRLLNDTALGKLLQYAQDHKGNNKATNKQTNLNFPFTHSEYIHTILSIISNIQRAFQLNPAYNSTNIQNIALKYIINVIQIQTHSITKAGEQPSNSISSIQLSEQMLGLCLHECSKVLSRLCEKLRPMYVNRGSGLEHVACFGPQVIERVINNKTAQEIHPYRGLYLALNHVQMRSVIHQSQVIGYKQKRLKHYICQIVSKYSTYKLITNQSLFLNPNLLQSPLINPKYKLLQSITIHNTQHLLLFGQYHKYIKLVSFIDSLFTQYYELIMHILTVDYTKDYENLLLELELMYKGNCWFDHGEENKLTIIAGNKIENKVWLCKKMDTLLGYKTLLLDKETMSSILIDIPSKLIQQTMPKLYTQTGMSFSQTNSLSTKSGDIYMQQSEKYQYYLQQIQQLGTKVIIINSKLHTKLATNHKIQQLQQLVRILPHLNQKIIIAQQQSKSFFYLFNGEMLFSSSNGQQQQQQENNGDNNNNYIHQESSTNPKRNTNQIPISQIRFKTSFINSIVNSLSNSKTKIITQAVSIFANLTQRQYHQFKSKKQIENEKRLNNNLYFQLFHLGSPFRSGKAYLKQILNILPSIQYQQQIRINKLVNLIHIRMLLFSTLQLSPQQQTHFRLIFFTQSQTFPIFWKDETSNLIKSPQFVRLKNFRLQSPNLLQRYRREYFVYNNLRSKYKSMIDKLCEGEIEKEMQDAIYIIVNCMFYTGLENKLRDMISTNSMNSQSKHYYQYLHKYGDDFSRPDTLNQFLISIIKQHIPLNLIYKRFNFNKLKKSLLSHSVSYSKNTLFKQFQQRTTFLRYHINNLKLKQPQETQVTNELLLFSIMKWTLAKILQNVGIDSAMHRQKLEIFSKKFVQKVNQKTVSLTQREKTIMQFPPMSSQVRSRFQALKDQAMQSVYFVKYYHKVLSNKLYQLSESILTKQLQLRRCLGDSLQHRQLNSDNKIYTQTLNKVLAPKVMLNPFLNSPLSLNNYFFAGTLKLSYIDQFLNKMKNRATMVELAEGGFGFLLKVPEVQQCVNALCKGIVAFSQKQFQDRLRTYFEFVEDLKEKLTKTRKQNQYLKSINKLHALYDEKQIKCLLYQKLHSYIDCITDKQKTHNTLFSMFKNLQNNLMKQCSTRYQSRIKQLQQENFVLKRTFRDFEQKLKKGALNSVSQSRDKLYIQFKQKMEKILNKEFIPGYDDIQITTFVENQTYESNILLHKLKEQSIVTKLKTNLTNQQYEKKILQLEKKLAQKQQLLSEIKQQREKNYHLKNQVKQLAYKAIQVEALQKQRKIDLQERMMEKFKLIRVNQALQGKLSRLETQPAKSPPIQEEPLPKLENSSSNKKTQYLSKTFNSEFTNNKQPSVFLTKQPDKRSKTQFGMQTIKSSKKQTDSFVNSRIRKRSVINKTIETNAFILQAKEKFNTAHDGDEGRVWRQKWMKSENKYQKLVEKVKSIGENFKISKNGRKAAEKMILLIDEINCEPIMKKPQLNDIL